MLLRDLGSSLPALARTLLFAVLLLLAMQHSELIAQTTVQFVDSNPVCAQYQKTDPDTGQTYILPPNTYCTQQDRDRNSPHYAIKLLRPLLTQGSVLALRTAYFAQTSESFVRLVCDVLSANTSQFVAITRRYVDDEDRNSSLAVRQMEECANSKNVSNVVTAFRGHEGDFLSFHLKVFAAALSSGTRLTAVSSGNPTTGSEHNIDHLLLITEPQEVSPFYDWHQCIVDLFGPKYRPEYQYLARAYADCRATQASPQIDGVSAFLLPFDRQHFLTTMAFYSARSKRISVFVQSADALPYRVMFELALSSGVALRVLRDDDLAYAHQGGRPGRQYMNDKFEYTDWLEPLLSKGAEARFLQTNHHSEMGNFVHAKMILFELLDGKKIAYLGAGNLTDAAVSANFENNYVVSRPDIVAAAENMFEKYWSAAFDLKRLPPIDLKAKPIHSANTR